jgi:uncharacterized protein YndB with AHSA1/START domain
MATRKQVRDMELPVAPERAFGILLQPSAIRAWWGAARAIVVARPGGVWTAAWGEKEDDPDYVSSCRIRILDWPRRLVMGDCCYHTRTGPLPFEADFVTEFTVEPRPGGCVLRVTQDGFPAEPVADAFYADCEVGWRNTFDAIKRFLAR